MCHHRIIAKNDRCVLSFVLLFSIENAFSLLQQKCPTITLFTIRVSSVSKTQIECKGRVIGICAVFLKSFLFNQKSPTFGGLGGPD